TALAGTKFSRNSPKPSGLAGALTPLSASVVGSTFIPGESTRALDAGDVPLCSPAGREPQTDSRFCGVGVHRQGGEYRADRRHRKGQDWIGLRPAAEGAGKWLPLPVRQGPELIR